jgi:hypothetical protein
MYDNKLDNTPLQRAFDKAAREENLDPRGLPMDMIARMEATIRANPDEYPEINAALDRIEARRVRPENLSNLRLTAPTREGMAARRTFRRRQCRLMRSYKKLDIKD